MTGCSPQPARRLGIDLLRGMIEDECIVSAADVETLRRLLAVYEAVTPLVNTTHALTQLEWNGVMSRLRFAVSEFERGGPTQLALGADSAYEHCRCEPWAQRWKPDAPHECSACGRPFKSALKAREVCLLTPACLLLPGHDGECGGVS